MVMSRLHASIKEYRLVAEVLVQTAGALKFGVGPNRGNGGSFR